MMTQTSQGAVIMIDIETLGKGPTAVVTQMAFMAVTKEAPDPVDAIRFDSFYLPVQPQVDMGRAIDASTILWWLDQPRESLDKLRESLSGGDADELTAYVRSFIRKIMDVVQDYGIQNVEFWARGPEFDMTILESLMTMVGETAPWNYDRLGYRQIRDLRTLMRVAGVESDDVDSSDIVKHVALEDCRFQLRCLVEAVKRISQAGALVELDA